MRSWPFPPAVGEDDGAVLATLRRRTEAPRSLYAELAMSFEGAGQNGVFDVVASYRRPGWLRLTAFRDLLVSTRDIFDLVLTPERFAMVIEGGESAEGAKRSAGAAGELGSAHRGFLAFAALREKLFLPGLLTEGESAEVERREGRIFVRARMRGGAEVTWRLEPSTLGIEAAELRVDGEAEPIRIEYSSYREVEGTFLPERFELDDRGGGVVIRGVLKDVEMDPELEDGVFRLPEDGGGS